MTSSTSSRKRTGKSSSEPEITGFELFYQLTFMSTTAAAGISRHKLFELARELPSTTAPFFARIHDLADSLRYNYPDACRVVGRTVKSEKLRAFLLRFSDALRSGEPMPPFLEREAHVQGEYYTNEYEGQLESMKKWNDGYVAITVSAALIVIINMVSTMIYPVGNGAMIGMALVAIFMAALVAWVLFRAAPQEVKCVPLSEGCSEQRLTLKLLKICVPAAAVILLVLALLGVGWGWTLVLTGAVLAPLGIVSLIADNKVSKKDEEINAFVRSLGGAATSRGTTLTDALNEIKIDSFPVLLPDIRTLFMRLNAIRRPKLCWGMFGTETGSLLASQTSGVFYESINLGGDPETVGILTSLFALKTAMLRAKRSGVSATFSYLTMIMHGVLAGLMVFLLEILVKFIAMLEAAMELGGDEMMQGMAMGAYTFAVPDTGFMRTMVLCVMVALAAINAFAIVASEGSHLTKISYYLFIMLILSGLCFIAVPPVVRSITLGAGA